MTALLTKAELRVELLLLVDEARLHDSPKQRRERFRAMVLGRMREELLDSDAMLEALHERYLQLAEFGDAEQRVFDEHRNFLSTGPFAQMLIANFDGQPKGGAT